MAGRQVKSKSQTSREAAVDMLLKEITEARKAADDFLKKAGVSECRAAILTGTYPAMHCSGHTYEAYKCICIRLKVLQSLLESMEDTAKQLGQLGVVSPYLN